MSEIEMMGMGSMNVGICGLGKLGLPVAYTFASKGHNVTGYDTNSEIADYLENGTYPYQEEGLPELMEQHSVSITRSIGELVSSSEMIFVPVQTPHKPEFEGTTRLPEERSDFEYGFLKIAIAQLAFEADKQKKDVDLIIISTVLPGTVEREIRPLLNKYTHLAYEPMFIAMGTVVEDVLNPEFTLIGVDEPAVADRLENFHKTIHDAPALRTDITTAEAIKVSYNTWITTKTVIANIWGEIADKTGAKFEDIFKAWELSTNRLISTKYMRAGMSDGGGCHPRDNIALSYLARKLNLSHDIFTDLMKAREDYEDYHARQAVELSKQTGLPLVVLGESFKPETNIKTGSAAVLMGNLLKDYGYPFAQGDEVEITEPSVVFIATNHARYEDYQFPPGSVVINPFKHN